MIMKMKLFVKWFVEWFVFITTGILMICVVDFAYFSEDELIPKATLSYILLSGFLTAAITAAFSLIEPVKKSGRIICFLLHVVCMDVAMVGCGLWFGWIDFVQFGILKMCLSVAGVYVFVVFFYYILDKHRAEQMNQSLRIRYRDEEDIMDGQDGQYCVAALTADTAPVWAAGCPGVTENQKDAKTACPISKAMLPALILPGL